jgi:hypothetical protein
MKPVKGHRPALRICVRDYFALLEGRRATVEDITAAVCAAMRPEERKPDTEEIRSVVGWMIDRGEVAAVKNETLERTEYKAR